MSDLIIALDKVEARQDGGKVGKLGLAHCKEGLDHVLCALVNVAFVQDGAEPLKDVVQCLGRELQQQGAALLDKVDGHLDTVVGGLLQKQHEHLKGHQLVGDLDVDEVGNELGQSDGHDLVVALKGAAELNNDTGEQELANLWQLGVHNRHQGGVDVRKARAGHLGLHQGAHQQAAASHKVLLEQLRQDAGNVGDIDLVDEAVQGLAQCIPGHALVGA